MPTNKIKELQRLPIRVDLQHELSNMQYHPDRGWLERNGYDPNLEKRVHLPRETTSRPRTWLKHPWVILHDAHAYHDQILGFEHPEIINAYKRAEKWII